MLSRDYYIAIVLYNLHADLQGYVSRNFAEQSVKKQFSHVL